jgi:N-acetylmuramoyl-L-alanine amidase
VKRAVIVLSAGHGAGDPGAVNGPHREADQCIFMVDTMAEVLRGLGHECVKVPHELGLKEAITWVNARYAPGRAWALEIHRDSAEGLDFADASNRCGVYHGTSRESKAIATDLLRSMLDIGAGSKSWARPDAVSRHKRLAWIRGPRVMSHLLELGFMEGDNSPAHLRLLAGIAARAVAATR